MKRKCRVNNTYEIKEFFAATKKNIILHCMIIFIIIDI